MKATKLVALVVILGVAGMAMAQDKEGKKRRERPKGIAGKIVKVEGTNVVIQKRARKGEQAAQVTVATDDETKVSIDRKEAKVGDLKEGMFVFVTPDTGTAKRIHAMTKMREHKRKPKKEN